MFEKVKYILKIIRNILLASGGIIAASIVLVILFALVIQIIVIIDYKIEYPNLKIKEADVMQQIAIEKPALSVYKPIIDYIEEYRVKNNTYPDELPQEYADIVSDKFEGFEYEVTEFGGYSFKIFPKHGPVEYYEPQTLYKWRAKDKDMEDGFLDNEYYYNIGEDWRAIHYQYYTRYTDSRGDVEICLDDGGCWDYIRHRCEKHDQGYCERNEQDCLKRNGTWQEDKKYCKMKDK